MNLLSILLFSFLSLLAENSDINLLFAGDAMQHGPQVKNARRADGSFDYAPCFEAVEKQIKKADFAVVNLECPLGVPYSGYPSFSAPVAFARQLRDSGFDFFLTANNHILDKGDKGAARTLLHLDSLGIPSVGVYRNAAARDTLSPRIVDVKGSRIAFIGATYGTNSGGGGLGVVVDRINRNRMKTDIDKAHNLGADFVVVLLHWGIEYQLSPNTAQRELAQFLADSGADLIIGTHPHVVQPLETVTSSDGRIVPVAYSLGNFISNQNDTYSRGGAMAYVVLHRDSDGVKVADARYSYVFVQKPHNGRGAYQLLPTDSVHLVLPHSQAAFKAFTKRFHN